MTFKTNESSKEIYINPTAVSSIEKFVSNESKRIDFAEEYEKWERRGRNRR